MANVQFKNVTLDGTRQEIDVTYVGYITVWTEEDGVMLSTDSAWAEYATILSETPQLFDVSNNTLYVNWASGTLNYQTIEQ